MNYLRWVATMLLVLVGYCGNAQTTYPNNVVPKTIYTYYVSIDGVKGKKDIEYLENTIPLKPGVAFFQAYGHPIRCFRLKSNTAISQAQVTAWINRADLKIVFYGEGMKAAEQATKVTRQLAKSH